MIHGDVTEATYSSDLKEWINEILRTEATPFGEAKVEISKDRKRADILLFNHDGQVALIIEVKRPEVLPVEIGVRKQAAEYASSYQPTCKQFATHNVNLLVLWDARTEARIDQFAVTYVRDLAEYLRNHEEIKESLRKFLRWYSGYLRGAPPTPLDESIVNVVNRLIRGIVNTTDWINLLAQHYVSDAEFRKSLQQWLVERGWSDPEASREVLERYCGTLAAQFMYLLVNKILFYNVLREKFRVLPRLGLPPELLPEDFHPLLSVFLERAMMVSRDYETVFQTDFVDRLQLSAQVVVHLKLLIEYLNSLDYSAMGNFDVIGKVFEHLIPEEERHLHGQFFTRTDLVDLLLAFCLRNPDDKLLDPGCGSGTFLVRGYHRLNFLRGQSSHSQLLSSIWGIDLDKFAAHFSTINLARQDLVSEGNYPNIVHSDFFAVPGPNAVVRIGLQTNILDWAPDAPQPTARVIGLDSLKLERTVPFFMAIAGNPPFTEQRELIAKAFGEDYKERILNRLRTDFPGLDISLRSGIYVYFIIHALRFLGTGIEAHPEKTSSGRLGFITLRNWLDVEYGEELKNFLLKHVKIKAILESRDEEWFPTAQMLPVALVLETSRASSDRDQNLVRFVQFQRNLHELIPSLTNERNQLQEVNRWQHVDRLVAKIEGTLDTGSRTEFAFGTSKLSIDEIEGIRITSVPQSALSGERKWSKFLAAPKSFFSIVSDKRSLLTPLLDLADLRRGLTSPKAAFFYLPNRHFAATRSPEETILVDRHSQNPAFRIENRFLEPMLLKIKRHQAIEITESDGYGLFVPPMSGVEIDRYLVKEYLNYGLEVYGPSLSKHAKKERPWFSVTKPKPAPILVRSLYLARYTAYWNNRNFVASNPFFEVRPKPGVEPFDLLAVLNSSLTALMLEFSGRYRENRDRTITNQVSLDDMRNTLVLDPRRLSPEICQSLRDAIQPLLRTRQSADGLRNPKDIATRQELDTVVFREALGLSASQMKDAVEGLSQLVTRRLRSKKGTLIEDEDEGEET